MTLSSQLAYEARGTHLMVTVRCQVKAKKSKKKSKIDEHVSHVLILSGMIVCELTFSFKRIGIATRVYQLPDITLDLRELEEYSAAQLDGSIARN